MTVLPLEGSFVYENGKLLTRKEYLELMQKKGFHFKEENTNGHDS